MRGTIPEAPRQMRRESREIVITALLLVGVLVVLRCCTNSLDTHKFSWDFRYYIAMAQDPASPDAQVAPFAYRYLWTEVVRGLHRASGLTVDQSFAAVAYAGVFAELMLLYLFLRRWGAGTAAARWAMLWTALALCNAKFLLFDVYRPEVLAYPLMILAIYALATGRTAWCIALSVIGLQVREFLAIPILLSAVFAAWPRIGPVPDRPPHRLRAAGILLLAILAIALPRVLLPVTSSFQALDVQHNARAWRGIIGIPLNLARDLNLLYCLLSYGLPLWILWTPRRGAELRARLGSQVGLLAGYALLTLGLTLYGGTDVFRFVAYLFLPQAVLLALLAERAQRSEKVYALIATAVFNRVFLPIPMSDLDHFLDFYGGWSGRLTQATLARSLEAVCWIAGALLLRALLARRPGSAAQAVPMPVPE
jgi:hypothetical protein